MDGYHSGEMASVIIAELQAVAKGSVTDVELSRAKTATISSVLMNLESRAVVVEDIGRQILTYGERKSVASFTADVSAITTADLAAVASKLLKTPLTFVRAPAAPVSACGGGNHWSGGPSVVDVATSSNRHDESSELPLRIDFG